MFTLPVIPMNLSDSVMSEPFEPNRGFREGNWYNARLRITAYLSLTMSAADRWNFRRDGQDSIHT